MVYSVNILIISWIQPKIPSPKGESRFSMRRNGALKVIGMKVNGWKLWLMEVGMKVVKLMVVKMNEETKNPRIFKLKYSWDCIQWSLAHFVSGSLRDRPSETTEWNLQEILMKRAITTTVFSFQTHNWFLMSGV